MDIFCSRVFLLTNAGELYLNTNTGSPADCAVSGSNCICTHANIYHIQSGYTPHDFIEVKTKSCEHFGHKTINSKELCRNGSLVLGYDYHEVNNVYRFDMAGTDNWQKAKDDCEAEGLQLCSLADICPDGPLSTPFGGVENKDTWVPVIDEVGAHVSVKYSGRRPFMQKACRFRFSTFLV